MRIVPRTEIGLPEEVRGSSGSLRPLIRVPFIYKTFHWPGVNVNFGDIGDTKAEILGIENYARRAGKPNEYNWVIDQDFDDLVYEYAGLYRAAHSAGENSIAPGILILNGINEVLKERQIKKIQWLNAHLNNMAVQDGNTQDRGHRSMPGAATACPGNNIMASLRRFNDPYVGETPTPPEPKPPVVTPKPPVPVDPPDSASGVGYYLVADGTTPWGISAECYGTGTRWDEIMAANDPDTTPNPYERWIVPGFSGIWTTVETDEGPWGILDRLFGTDGWNKNTGVDQFWQWNGGDIANGGRRFNGVRRALQPGERVWVRN